MACLVQHPAWRYRVLFPALARMPMPLGYRLAGSVGARDLRCAGPEKEAFRAGVAGSGLIDPRIALERFYRMRAREVLDAWWIRRVGGRAAGRLLSVAGEVRLSRLESQGRGVILVMAHYGRLNLLLLALALRGHRLGMLTVDVDDPRLPLHAAERAFLRFKVAGLHRRIGGAWIHINEGMRRLYRAVGGGETVVVLLDAYDPRFRLTLDYPFLDGRLHVAAGILRVARRTGAALLYGVVRERDWRVQVELRSLPEEPEAAMAQAVAELESDVQARPWEWWQWPLVGRLWRPGAQGETRRS